ncbi:MAG: hypothetical protein NC416_12585 [Eubacterium sp.]|nr:hypothetical protein [Eubacterium sp.]
MREITFDEIWDNIIIPMTDLLLKRMKSVDANIQIHVCNLPQDKAAVREIYENTKKELKQLYHYNSADEEQRIDIHKVAACFASVLMEYKVFRFEIEEQTSDEVFLSNARLSFSVSLAIIKDNLLYKYREDSVKANWIATHKLYMPQTTPGHDTFSLGRVKTLMLNSIFLNEFDILSYSDMLYWVELFNIMILEDKKAIEYIAKSKEDDRNN